MSDHSQSYEKLLTITFTGIIILSVIGFVTPGIADVGNDATPTPTSTPSPTATSTPSPTATSTPSPTATSTPSPTPTDTPDKPTQPPETPTQTEPTAHSGARAGGSGGLGASFLNGENVASESFITGPVQSVDIVFSRAVFGKVLIQRARNAPPDSIKDRAILHFTIEVPDADWGYNDVVLTIDRDRVEEKNVEPSELEIVRIPDKAPIERLETNVDTSGPDSIVISTAIQNFSVFALVVTPDQATETAASTSTPSPSPTSLVTASPTNTQVEPSQKTREMSSTLGTDDEMSADSPTPTETSGPGLGIIAASLSLLAGLAWARSRQLWSN